MTNDLPPEIIDQLRRPVKKVGCLKVTNKALDEHKPDGWEDELEDATNRTKNALYSAAGNLRETHSALSALLHKLAEAVHDQYLGDPEARVPRSTEELLQQVKGFIAHDNGGAHS